MHGVIEDDLEVKWLAEGHMIGKQTNNKTNTLSKTIE